ncbi:MULTISPECIES: hypothetical protein [Citrobacter]|uniref:hypothetical protein n=1 Tax=Citrobacter TaxID=544 RepID=UPI0015E9C7AE|nr:MULTISPECIES: hypothetical protein [Citrobacter]QLY03730.1 hypothetical protein HV243_15140 [Citrobacter sp. RHBSTW-00599]
MSSRENIERWVSEIDEDGMCDISDNQVTALIRDYNCMAVQLANAESKCRELAGVAAENAALKKAADFATAPDMWIEQADGMLDYRYCEWYVDVLKAAMETPATDAFLAEARASELDSLAGVAETMLVKFSNQLCSSDMHEVVGWKMVLQQASNRAAQLRKGPAL